MLRAFRVSEPTTKSIGPTRDEVYNFYHDLTVLNCRSEKYSTVVYHKQRLIAFSLCDVKNLGDIKEPSKEIDVNYYDFAEKIRDGPYEHHKANQLLVYSETLEQKRKQLHGNSAKVMYIDVVVVDKDYRRCGIANELVQKAVELARAEGCDWVSACATSAASQELLKNMNFETLYEIPYASFREKGKPVFINLDDSCDAGRYMGLQLK
ncbi:acetyltransferase, GNAT family [Oesophagostomum dentatum]|uniref:Acetyltransferase, GNAT family n=1 Tax=Oesophagostomum dentatum TaxID=61180 RepID=A0A0B1T1T7_OESDE|nr:acetyltransferase, GNAT family [Oesophagostomum dentatum]